MDGIDPVRLQVAPLKAWQRPLGVLTVLLLALTCPSCWVPGSKTIVSGLYVASHPSGARDTLWVYPDGRFVQHVRLGAGGQVSTRQGTWLRHNGDSIVVFEPGLFAMSDVEGRLNPEWNAPDDRDEIPIERWYGRMTLMNTEAVGWVRVARL
jgi:hypothetical protein